MSKINLEKNATEQDERDCLDFETHKFLDRIKKLNKLCKHIQVTDVKIKISHPAMDVYYPKWMFWKRKNVTIKENNNKNK